MNSRSVAASILLEVLKGQSLSEQLTQIQHSDANFIREMCLGVMRFQPRLDRILRELLKRPLKEKDKDILSLLYLGLYQIDYMRVPDHAAVAETVSGLKIFNKSWAKALLNGVLRNYLREKASIQETLQSNEEYRYAHPQWLIDLVKSDWPQQWQALLDANNQQAPLHLRICQQHISRDDYLQHLHQAGVEAEIFAHSEQGLILQNYPAIEQLPGYQQGWFYVQDLGAQMAAQLLGVEANMRVLDACAAPGGKALHILDRAPELARLDCLEYSAPRLARLQENFSRYGLHQEKSHFIQGDAALPQNWWGNEAYDRILLDIPCSGTGVIRRKPDIKHHRRAEQLATLIEKQRGILKALWPLLQSGGYLLYCTCSVLKQENNNQMHWFLSEFENARIRPIHLPIGQSLSVGHQFLTNSTGTDGFYYACLEKTH